MGLRTSSATDEILASAKIDPNNYIIQGNVLKNSTARIANSGFISFGLNPPTAFGDNEGVFIGFDNGPKVSLFSNYMNYFKWDGSKLLIQADNFTLDENGNITATNVDLTGKITATEGFIGGWSIVDNSLCSDKLKLSGTTPAILMGDATDYLTGSGLFIGLNSGLYRMSLGDPNGEYLAWDGSHLKMSGSWIGSTGVNPTLQEWRTNIVFSSSGTDIISWTSGTIELSDGVTYYSINSGSTNSMTLLTYIYLDVSISLTDLQTSTVYSDAVGDGKILLASAQNNQTGASVVPYSGQQPILDGSQIIAQSILAGQIAASSITADKLSINSLSAITGNMGNLNVDGLLTLSDSDSAIAIGNPAPTSSTDGTGIWIDKTGVYGLNNNNNEFKISAVNGQAIFAGGSGIINSDGILMEGLNYFLKHTATNGSYTRSGRMRMFLPTGGVNDPPAWGFDYVGLALGSELLSNGSMNTNTTGWTNVTLASSGQSGNCGKVNSNDNLTDDYPVTLGGTGAFIKCFARNPINGDIYVGGSFTSINGVTANNIAYWNGTTWNALGSGTNNFVYDLAFESDGTLWVGGYFTTVNGSIAANYLATYKSGVWYGGTDINANNYVWHLYYSSVLNTLYVSGAFTSIGGVSCSYIISRNSGNWVTMPGLSYNVSDITSDNRGNVYVVGSTYVHRWSGGVWSEMAHVDAGKGVNSCVFDNYTNNLYVGGNFATLWGYGVGANTVNGGAVARWDGTNWFTVANGVTSYFSGDVTTSNRVYKLIIHNDRMLCAIGDFKKLSSAGATCNGIALIDTASSSPAWMVHPAGGAICSTYGYPEAALLDTFTGILWVGGQAVNSVFGVTSNIGMARYLSYSVTAETPLATLPASFDSIEVSFYIKGVPKVTAGFTVKFYDSGGIYLSGKGSTGLFSTTVYNNVWAKLSLSVPISDVPVNTAKVSIGFSVNKQPFFGDAWLDTASIKTYGSTTTRLAFQPALTLSGDPTPTPFFIQDQLTPTPAPTGFHGIYPKSDGWYTIDSAGNETPVGGSVATKMLNKSASTISKGDVLIFDTTASNAVNVTTYPFDIRVIGVAAADIASEANGMVDSVAGKVVTVNCDTGAVAIGQFLVSSTTAGKAKSAGYFRALGCFAIALSSKSSGSTGTVSAMLIDNFRQAIPGKAGYIFGGETLSPAVVLSASQKMSLTVGTFSNISSANLPWVRVGGASLTDTTVNAYVIGGSNNSNANGGQVTSSIMPFATEVHTATPSVNLTAGRYTIHQNGSCNLYGLIAGGANTVGTALATTFIVTFSNATIAAGTSLSSARTWQTILSDGTYAYMRGGTAVTCDRMQWATGTVAAFASGNLPASSNVYATLTFPALAGYGFYGSANNKIPYATGVNATVASVPTACGNLPNGITDGLGVGYSVGGEGTPYTNAYTFDQATETFSANANAALTTPASDSQFSSYGTFN